MAGEVVAAKPARKRPPTKRKPLSGKGRRAKGVTGEREVATAFKGAGFDVRGLEGLGDQIAVKVKPDRLLIFKVEAKRHERVRVREWLNQCRAETPEGMIPLVVFRENNEQWAAVLDLADLLELT